MKNKGLIPTLCILLLVAAVIVVVIRLASGVFSLLHGALDAVVGIVLIAALVVLVIWMFAYASKKKRK